MSAFHSSSSSSMQQQHELHVRRLLDERAERAGLSPVAPSDYVGGFETPSMYSARSPRAPFDDPNASELNLDDDDDTYPHPHSPPMSVHADDEDTDSPHDLEEDEEEEQEQRMSMLGPKMRFHSPAPWELDVDPIREQDEQDDDTRSFVSRRAKPGFIKSLGLGGSSKTSRPSTDSSRSSGREKKSFETTSSYVSAGGALHALAQASMSSTSLTHTQSPSARSKFPLSRPRTRTQSGGLRLHPPAPVSAMPSPSSTQASPSGYHTRSSSPAPSAYSTALSRTDTRTSSRPTSPLGQEFIHPYANPEVSSPYRDSFHIPPVPSRAATTSGPEGNSSGHFALHAPRSASPSGSVAPSIAPSIPSGAGDHNPRRQGAGLNGRTISGPMPMDTSGGTLHSAQSYSSMRTRTNTRERDPKFPQQMPAGYAELPSSPNFNLISLQEAQAQARTRSVTGQSSSNAPFLHEDPSRSNHTSGRPRMRSTSAGAKVREDANAVSPVAGGPPPKLKHKKSGFMRLFNKGDEPPPVPPLIYANQPVPPSEYSLSSMSSSTNMSTTSPYTPRPQARVPVPQLTPEDERPSPLSSSANDGPPSAGSARRKHPPPLAIVPPTASSHTHVSGSLFSSQEGNPSRTTLMPERSSPRMEEQQRYERVPRGRGEPSSAPPGAPQFPSLSLRPVSTIFSAHFAELGGDFAMDLDRDASHSSTTSGRSPTSALSPITPGFPPSYGGGLDPSRAGSESGALIVDANSDDPNAVISALQAQITGARKAWQRQIWELEGQVRDLRAEMEEMRAKERSGERCAFCGRGGSAEYDEDVLAPHTHEVHRKGSFPATPETPSGRGGVVNRPRARTGVGGRFGAAT